MGFETIIMPVTAPQVAIYSQPAASFSPETLEQPVFGAKPRTVSLDSLSPEPQLQNTSPKGGWLVYDETHLFNPHQGQSLYIGEQETNLHPHMAGKKYGELFPSRLLPQLITTRPMPRLEEMKAHVLEYGVLHYILEAVSPAQELLFRRVGRPNWSGLGEDHLIVFKRNGEWVAEYQSKRTKPASVKKVGEGLEAAYFEHGVLPSISQYWTPQKRAIPVYTTNPSSSELPSVAEIQEVLQSIPSFLLGGIQAVQLVDEELSDAERGQYLALMNPKGIVFFYRGSHDIHLHSTLFHELTHWFAMRVLGSVFLAEQAHWIRAMMQDAVSPSQYATTTIGEGLAELGALYFLTGGGRFGKAPVHFRNFFKLLDALFHDCFTDAYHDRYTANLAAHSHASI